jgi:aminoglycoside phosphotransferase (APT) family kinase protein
MAIPQQRDPEVTRAALTQWLGEQMPGAAGVEISELAVPPATGFSNETILFDAQWRESDGSAGSGRFVLRIGPTGYSIYLEPQFEEQYRILAALGPNTDVPVAPVPWFERDTAVLGAPFYVMTRVDGDVPGDTPPYTTAGFLFDATPHQQATAYDSALSAMARVHAVDWKSLGLDFLDRPSRGALGLDQELSYYERFFTWAMNGRPHATLETAFDWLRRNRPAPGSEPVTLCWGDARIGNVMFNDFQCVAVFDWEMANLGNPMQDLGWWKFLDRHHSEGSGVPRLPGFPSYAQTERRYEELTGTKVENLDYYEVFAGARFGVIMVRIADLVIEYGMMPPDTDLAWNNAVTRLLAPMVGAPPPSGA